MTAYPAILYRSYASELSDARGSITRPSLLLVSWRFKLFLKGPNQAQKRVRKNRYVEQFTLYPSLHFLEKTIWVFVSRHRLKNLRKRRDDPAEARNHPLPLLQIRSCHRRTTTTTTTTTNPSRGSVPRRLRRHSTWSVCPMTKPALTVIGLSVF